jgi:hypothetical protein
MGKKKTSQGKSSLSPGIALRMFLDHADANAEQHAV